MGAYDEMTVEQLREEAKARGLVTTGNKDELVARLEEAAPMAPDGTYVRPEDDPETELPEDQPGVDTPKDQIADYAALMNLGQQTVEYVPPTKSYQGQPDAVYSGTVRSEEGYTDLEVAADAKGVITTDDAGEQNLLENVFGLFGTVTKEG